ncbi:PREDICTED: adenylate isopentenyltransferase-like [Nelumbo nucifera]|uniref:Adenylate isopentenyltransferase-like n=2 Tax=Nelumbo nucifera TaxID=4432 RepID=A0A822YW56_NELNU|nr:PREDICTED: adenylate isopentenyltransferase-like [Nelumbo nucifera]DAD35365.1 TPA_asm: hypothetical protein HUJ06_006005 [Nelumbo nucifera]
MRLSFPTSYSSRVPSLRFLPAIKPARQRCRWVRMESTTRRQRRKDKDNDKNKIVVIMGVTGTGKSRLSIEIATRFPAEVINSDKMQVYRGLDITTNKIPMHERLGVPHHLLGVVDPSDGELSSSEYRLLGASAISAISARHRLPLVVGGSNSFIHALVSDRFDPGSDGLDGLNSVSAELRYDCCFLWVDVSLPVLYKYLARRVDDMLHVGMFEELAVFYEQEGKRKSHTARRVGIRKAIGLPEFVNYFRVFRPGDGMTSTLTQLEGEVERRVLFEEAVKAIKDNTNELAKRQLEKIQRLRSGGWDLQRLDATEAFRAVLASDSVKSSEIWESEVLGPSVKIVSRFLA